MNPREPTSVIELLQAMVGFDTVTPRDSGRPDAEHALAEWLHALATGWGFKAEWLPVEGFSPNLLVTCETDPSAPWWLFDSHLDTVGVQGMTVDPFAGELRDNGDGLRLWGRGACDTKGTGASMLWALRQTRDEGHTRDAGGLGGNVALLFTVCEEDHQQGATTFAESSLPRLPWRPAGVVVGEPTRMRAVAASNGFVRWRLHTHGVAAHSSSPHLGRNAIVDMAAVIQLLQEGLVDPINAGSQPHPLTGGGSCSINLIRGGAQSNVVPEHCVIDVDQRVPPGALPGDAVLEVDRLLRGLADERPGLRWEITDVETAPPFDSPESRRLADEVAGVLAGAGIASGVIGAPYTTNANHYAAHGLPCVVLGPGDIAHAHTKAESIAARELQEGVKGYAALMRSAPAAVGG